jgi:hypothetical protein
MSAHHNNKFKEILLKRHQKFMQIKTLHIVISSQKLSWGGLYINEVCEGFVESFVKKMSMKIHLSSSIS